MNRRYRVIGAIVLIVAATTAALLQVRKLAKDQIQTELSKTTEVAAGELRDRIQSFIAERIIALRQVGIFFENSQEVTPPEFRDFAEKTVANVPGFQAIEYVDAKYIVQRVYPLEENRSEYGRDLKATPEVALLNKSKETGMVVATDPTGLAQGGVEFTVYVPVYKMYTFEGFIRGVFRLEDLLRYLLSEHVEKRFSFSLQDSTGKTVYVSSDAMPGERASKVTRTMNVGDKRWQIEIWSEQELLAGKIRIYDVSIIVFGLMFVASVGSLIWFLGRRSEVLESEVEKRTQKLEERTRDLDQARRQLARSEERYRHLVHGLDAIVWEADAVTLQFTFVSQQAQQILGYEPEAWLTDPTFWMDRLHPADRDWVIEFYKLAALEKRDLEFEYRMMAVDGRAVWLHNSVRPDWRSHFNR